MTFTADEIDRFWSKIDKSNDCWLWLSARGYNGYGILRVRGKNVYAHRMSYIIHKGDIVKGTIMHSCDQPSCVNPTHLSDGTVSENGIPINTV